MAQSASSPSSLNPPPSPDLTESASGSSILYFPTRARTAASKTEEEPLNKDSGDTVRPSWSSKQPDIDQENDLSPDAEPPVLQPYSDLDSGANSGANTPSRANMIGRSLDPGTYWRLAEHASTIPSTRTLERREGGTVKERREAYYKASLVNVALILSWYTFSTLISVYNKWMFSSDKHNFSFPLFVTSFHMLMQFLLSSFVMKLFGNLVPRRANGTRARPSGANWISKVVPCALATALDIGLSNTSLKTITLTFYTMCKSSNLAFVLFFAFLFGLEAIRWSLIGIITLITVGVVMMVAAETKFVLVGAVQVLTASALGGLRWALTQMLLDRDEMGMNNPIATIFWLAPVMGVSLISLSAIFEKWSLIFAAKSGWFNSLPHALKTIGLIIAPGFLAFGMNLAEFALIKRTSVVTLSVAGIFKEVLTIALASSVFGDELTPINITGLCITLLGITLYNFLKYRLITQGADSVGQEIAGLSELSESIRSRASSMFHGIVGHTPTAEREGTTRAGGYHHVGHEDEESTDLLFDRDAEQRTKTANGKYDGAPRRHNTGESDALELDTQRVSQDILSRPRAMHVMTEAEREAERQRQRRIEEEADMDGWGSAGTRVTGQGLVEEHHHHH